MKDKFLKRKYYECECGDMDHILRVSYFSDEPYELFIEVHLRQKSFIKRLWSAFLYVIGRRSRYGDFDEFLWGPDTVKDFNKFTEGFLKDQDEFFSKKK